MFHEYLLSSENVLDKDLKELLQKEVHSILSTKVLFTDRCRRQNFRPSLVVPVISGQHKINRQQHNST